MLGLAVLIVGLGTLLYLGGSALFIGIGTFVLLVSAVVGVEAHFVKDRDFFNGALITGGLALIVICAALVARAV